MGLFCPENGINRISGGIGGIRAGKEGSAGALTLFIREAKTLSDKPFDRFRIRSLESRGVSLQVGTLDRIEGSSDISTVVFLRWSVAQYDPESDILIPKIRTHPVSVR